MLFDYEQRFEEFEFFARVRSAVGANLDFDDAFTTFLELKCQDTVANSMTFLGYSQRIDFIIYRQNSHFCQFYDFSSN